MGETQVTPQNGASNHAKASLRSIAKDETYSLTLRLQCVDELAAIEGLYSTHRVFIADGATPTENGRKVVVNLLRRLKKAAEGNEIAKSVKMRLACLASGIGHGRWVVPGTALLRAGRAVASGRADTMSLLERAEALKVKHGIETTVTTGGEQ